MEKILIDTDILIDIANNDSTAKARLKSESQVYQLSISVITNMELIVGCRNKTELQALHRFLEQFYLLNLDQTISVLATQLLQKYRLSHNLLIPDAFIAATALSYQIPLLSKNQKDYRFISSLDLLAYP